MDVGQRYAAVRCHHPAQSADSFRSELDQSVSLVRVDNGTHPPINKLEPLLIRSHYRQE